MSTQSPFSSGFHYYIHVTFITCCSIRQKQNKKYLSDFNWVHWFYVFTIHTKNFFPQLIHFLFIKVSRFNGSSAGKIISSNCFLDLACWTCMSAARFKLTGRFFSTLLAFTAVWVGRKIGHSRGISHEHICRNMHLDDRIQYECSLPGSKSMNSRLATKQVLYCQYYNQ